MTEMTIARPIPGITPRAATPAKQTIDSQNSHCWMRKMRARSANSNRPMAAAITTAASALLGRLCSRLGAKSRSRATLTAPTTPVSCVFAPAASATGVREELLLIGNPWNSPAARLAAPSPTISWFGSTGAAHLGRVRARQDAGIGEGHHGDGAAADHHLLETPRSRSRAARRRAAPAAAGRAPSPPRSDRDRTSRPRASRPRPRSAGRGSA